MSHNNIPENRRKYVTYGWIVVYYRPQKDKPYRTRLTVGSNLIKYLEGVSTQTREITSAQ